MAYLLGHNQFSMTTILTGWLPRMYACNRGDVITYDNLSKLDLNIMAYVRPVDRAKKSARATPS